MTQQETLPQEKEVTIGDSRNRRKQRDEILWQQLRAGSMEAFEEIYASNFSHLYKYGLRICGCEETVKDGIQNLFVKIWNRRETVGGTNHIRFYLLASLRNGLLDGFGKSAREVPMEKFHDHSAYCQTGSHEDELLAIQIDRERSSEVLRALDSLTYRERETVMLRFFQGKNNNQIAQEMSISVEAVYNNVYKALKTLKRSINMPTIQ